MTATLDIRPCVDADRDAVVALWSACGLVVPWNDPAADFVLALSKDNSAVLAGVLDGRVVASVMVGQDGHRGWIYYLAVDPTHQGRGFGRRMVAEAESWLAAAGMPKVQLLVRNTNERVLAFYERLGYAKPPTMLMQKWLTNPSP
ncbi:GNAT family acetyltransferase [Azospirillum picis]|uniref:Ribosomal protein S18 acetylase RimI-like enzyme n=1 Tax=Azospirillum picis TaxID=488438 RepID=A0ABU0MGR8_9PROT|nr:GNAT family acetyltransferase [Azospirillum picis]MBP2298324.1 ribosomal protein S18 acetylase RimI-like enzyme [Azospirillum picis]MDQ0532627.1 ribosomal protein S18 acetylase RimI-like enzyme [Azospirillum picis]